MAASGVTYIVDGYNLLLRERGPLVRERGLERARAELERELERFLAAAGPGTRLVLVYDGARGVAGGARAAGALEVVFARPPLEADDVISSLCRRLEGEEDLHLVTSDAADIAGRLQGLRLRHWSTGEFVRFLEDRLERRSGRLPGGGEKPAGLSSEAVDGWLREFGMKDGEEGT